MIGDQHQQWYLNMEEADDYQIQVMEKRIDKPLIVTGCAGSGKSILALWKAKRIHDSYRGTCLYIVFTKALKQYMTAGIRLLGLSETSVDYFHNWKSQKYPAADYIIVDEAQDFTREDIFLFMRKARKAVFFFGDSAQQLYEFIGDRSTVDMEEIQEITGYDSMPLCMGHRLPLPIARVAQYISSQGGKKNDPLFLDRCMKRDGQIPKIIECNGIYDQYDTIINYIKNKIHGEQSIGILFRHNNQVKKAYEYFRDEDMDIDVKYDRGRGNKVFELDFGNTNPKMMTYHSAKGIQFDYVIIMDCKRKDDDEDDVIPLYVAMTRACKELIITHSGNLSTFFNKVPYNLYTTDLYASSQTTPQRRRLSF